MALTDKQEMFCRERIFFPQSRNVHLEKYSIETLCTNPSRNSSC